MACSEALLKPVPWKERSLVKGTEYSLYYHIVLAYQAQSEWVSQLTNLNEGNSIIFLQHTNPSPHYFTQK